MSQGSPLYGLSDIRFATTADGIDIATTTSGTGRPIVAMPSPPWFTMQMLEPIQALAPKADPRFTLSALGTLTRYDSRGTGLSDGDGLDLSLEVQQLDLQAVIDSVTDAAVVLLAAGNSGPAAITYAVAHPDRIAGLILLGSYARGSDYANDQRISALRGLQEQDWQTFTDALALQFIGWEHAEAAAEMSRLVAMGGHDGPTAQRAIRQTELLAEVDVTELLPQLEVPVLVIGRIGRIMNPEVHQHLAQAIPGARLALAPCSAIAPLLGDSRDVFEAIRSFLAELPDR